jgi:hypothetical protein
MSTRTFELYFNDLNDEAKDRLLKFEEVESDSDLNHEYIPLAILERENEDGE